MQICLIDGRAQEADVDLLFAESFVLEVGKKIAAFDFDGRETAAMFKHDLADRASQP